MSPNGLVFVWSDCDDDLIALAATRRFALRFTHHHDCVFDRPTFHLSPAQVEAARRSVRAGVQSARSSDRAGGAGRRDTRSQSDAASIGGTKAAASRTS